ncbi:MAG TPA: hypothetical protein VD995_03310 [Azospirillum sp.]|nr:hypothetical protein [Azospirillum sp.]
MAHDNTGNNVIFLKNSAERGSAVREAVIEELTSIMGKARRRGMAGYVAGEAEHSLGDDLMQVKAGLRAIEAMIMGTTERGQWIAMLELVTEKVDTIMERAVGAGGHAREA